MLFGKLFFTTFTLAAMAISHVASAPTAQPETAVIEKRDSASDQMNKCYTDVQTICKDIDQIIIHNGGKIDAKVAVSVKAKIDACTVVVAKACVDLQNAIKAGVSATVILNCGKTFILIVKLLAEILLKIFAACQSGAVTILVVAVVALKVKILLCADLILLCIDGLLGGLLGLILKLLLTLKIDIKACIVIFVAACDKFH